MKTQENKTPDLVLLETILAYTFQNRNLLERALTHRSWAHERVAPGAEDLARRLQNEALEFLGDSVLGLIVAVYVCRAYPEGTERSKDALLADALEAITGAIFLDGGLDAATRFVNHALGEELQRANPMSAAEADYKTMLQEKLQAERRPAPKYSVVETLGPPHRRMFHVEVTWDGRSVRGEGRSIKAAEVAAAKEALLNLKLDEAAGAKT
ncbi:MAG: hypothetical protein LC770_12950 [Acidobacteria bacterium]|nr:hypothetical protein [Acidobacteriota bacterium]